MAPTLRDTVTIYVTYPVHQHDEAQSQTIQVAYTLHQQEGAQSQIIRLAWVPVGSFFFSFFFIFSVSWSISIEINYGQPIPLMSYLLIILIIRILS